jgi:tricin synthase
MHHVSVVLQYMLKTMVYPRENEFLRELRLITKEHT